MRMFHYCDRQNLFDKQIVKNYTYESLVRCIYRAA